MVKKVAVVTESFLPQVNGVTGSVVRVLETFKQREIDALVIAPTSPSSKHLGFDVHTTVSLPVLQFPVAFPGPSISRALDSFEPDVVHVAAPFMLGAQAIAWANRRGVPSVVIYQTDVAGYLERYNLRFARGAMDRLIATIHQGATINLAPTRDSAEYLKSLGLGNVEIWGRGVDRDLFNPRYRETHESLELRKQVAPSGELVVGFVGRLAQEKQVHRMAELFGLSGVRFLVVGDGPERPRLEQLFHGYPVTFTGALTGLDLANAYGAMDIFTHFGTEETFGQTIQEAQSAGLAVVAPNSGGPRNLIDDGVTGYLVNHQVAGAYREAVKKLLDFANRTRVGRNAEAAVSGKSWSANNAKLIGHYESALAMTRARIAEQLELA